MECPRPSAVSALILHLVVFVMAAEPGIALKLEPTGTSSHFPPLLSCAPPAALSASNDSAFRDNLLALLAALPPAAAAAPTGFAFADAHSGSGGGDRVFARALCFGVGARRGSGASPGGGCLDCLSAAAQDVAGGCHGRRGAVWRAACFLAYADTNASTAREEAWRGWFYDGGDSAGDTPTAALRSQCTANANTTAAECSRCLNESARVVPALKRGRRRRLSLVHGDAVVVVGYSCYLRVPLLALAPQWKIATCVLVVVDLVGIVFLGLLFCIDHARNFNPA